MKQNCNQIGSFADGTLNSNQKDGDDCKTIEKINDCTPFVPKGTRLYNILD